MSLFEAMRTSVSGMNAQSGLLGGISQNIANSSTVGYKKADNQFETILGIGNQANYASGGVLSLSRYLVGEQGTLSSTGIDTNLAIQGGGFFVAKNAAGSTVLTRAGAFNLDSGGNFVNSAGMTLMGYDLTRSAAAGGSSGVSGLSAVNVSRATLGAVASTTGAIVANLPSDGTLIGASSLPSTNNAGAQFTDKTSMTVYDNLGKATVLDLYYARTGAGSWEATIFDASQASSGGGFPYASGPLSTQTLQFRSSDGKLTSPSPGDVAFALPGGKTIDIDISKVTQFASKFAVTNATANGGGPSSIDHVTVGEDGVVSGVYQDGRTASLFKIPLATVPSVDNLTSLDGNAFAVSLASGEMVVGDAGSGQNGNILSGALESSTVDLGNELTSMIQAQRNYSANSKVFQASADMLDVLMSLKV